MSWSEPQSLFDASTQGRPLAERLRPTTLDEYVGQEHILGSGKPLRLRIERDQLGSMILWGPPGVGKTTLGHLIAKATKADFVPFSAVMSGIKEIKAVMVDAERSRQMGRRTVIFVDEIHRFNKAQQDAFLPYVERGDIVLIGATTENPSFEVVGALLSRSKVYILRALTIAKDSTGNRVLSLAIEQSAENVTAGERLADPLRKSGFFPPDVVEMIAIAEESNNLEKVLIDLSDSLEKRTARQLDLMVKLLEPIMLLVMAGVTLVVVAGLLMPVFKMGRAVG